MNAQDRMSRDLRSVPPSLSVWSALAIMRQEDIRHLLVMEGERLVGVVSNRDYRRILERARPDGSVQHVPDLRVTEIMTPQGQLVTARPDTPMLDVASSSPPGRWDAFQSWMPATGQSGSSRRRTSWRRWWTCLPPESRRRTLGRSGREEPSMAPNSFPCVVVPLPTTTPPEALQ